MDKKCIAALDKKYKQLSELAKTFLGYPVDAEFDYTPLFRFLKFPINNVGDPFEASTYRLQTKEFEREVLRFFAGFLHLKDYWGYVTNGATEGNLYGLYAARETLPQARVYYTSHTHYSMKKNVHLLRMEAELVDSQPSGEMDYQDLERKLKGVKTAIIFANIGSTMTGAIDKVDAISAVLEKRKIRNYIHADAALYGMVLPFASKVRFDFQTKVQSIVISGHKFIGSPIPCGVVLVHRRHMEKLQSYIQYIDAHDTTISGSRDAFTPLMLWYRIKTLGKRGFKEKVAYSMGLADYLVKELNKIGWPGVRQSYITVSFKKPSPHIIRKWELASYQDIAHVICLPHETKEELHRFVNELESEQ